MSRCRRTATRFWNLPSPVSRTTTCSAPAISAGASGMYLAAHAAMTPAAYAASCARDSKWSASSSEMKLLGCLAARKMREALSIPTTSSRGAWSTSSALPSVRILVHLGVLDEGAPDAERPAGQLRLDLALRPDAIERAAELPLHVRHIGRRADRH